MTPDTLLIASTAGALWADDVEFGSESTVLRPTDALALAASVGANLPVLIVVEPPVTGLARRLAAADGVEPLAWLALWRESARALARFVRLSRSRTLVVEAADLLAHPAAVRDLVDRRLGARLSITTPQAPSCAPRPVALSLAGMLCSDDADTHELLTELRACCWPVGSDGAGHGAAHVPRPVTGGFDAARDLGELLQCASHADALAAQMASLRGEALSRQQQLAGLQQELAEATARQEAAVLRARELESTLMHAREQADAMLASAHEQGDARVMAAEAAGRQQVIALEELLMRQREELTRTACELERAQVRADSRQAKLDRVLGELERAQQDVESLRARTDREQALVAVVETHGRELVDLRESLARCEADRDAARAALEAAQSAAAEQQATVDRLTTMLHEVQSALADSVARSHADRDAAKSAADSAKAQLIEQQAAFDRLVGALHHVQEELERAHRQAVAERQNASAQMKSEQARSKEALAARDEKVAYLRGQAEQARAELTRIQDAAARTLEQARVEHEKSLAGLRAQADRAAAEGKAAREAVVRLEQELRTARDAHAKDRLARDEKIGWLRQQLEKARSESAERQQVQAELNRLAACQQSLEAQLAAARDEQLVQAAATKAARDEADELLAHLHEAQAQVELLHERHRELAEQTKDGRAEVAASPLAAPASAGRWTIVAERDTLPYRELSVRAARLTVGKRTADDCPVRLVEHHGHPGLVLFAPSGQPHPMPSWFESGREGDVPYMRLMPDDPSCRSIFDSMGSAEWLTVVGIARDLRDELESAVALGLAPVWSAIARRLGEALAEMPMRARADQVDVEFKVQGGGRDSLRLSLQNLTCGARILPRLQLVWRPQGGHASLTLLADPVTGPVLPVWPTDSSGQLADRLTLPIGRDVAGGVKRARWRSLPPADRAMLVAILDALPAWLEQVPQASSHVAIARALADDARSSCSAPVSLLRPRAALRRAVRMLGAPAPVAA